MPTIKLTRKSIEAIEHPESGQILYRDSQLKGFGLRVGTQSKVFFAEGQVNHRTRRVTIGRADILSVEEARRRAIGLLANMVSGIDPSVERKRKASRNLSLKAAFSNFFEARSKLAENTVGSYSRTLNLYLKDWREKALADITRQDVLTRHRRIAGERGEVTANNVMRHLSSVYNFVAASNEELPPNPVTVLKLARAWYPEKRRQTLISASDLPAWWHAVHEDTPLARDLLLTALFTGMRRNEISGLRWTDIDFRSNAIRVENTKNGDPLNLPLSGFMSDLLRRRKLASGANGYVFPGSGAQGHIVETKTITARISERSGVKFTMHDLRRTFTTIAESIDIPHYALKRLINHRTSNDVTGGYIVIDVERLREPAERVSCRILELATVSEALMERQI